MTFDSRALALSYASLSIVLLLVLWRWHTDPRYKDFTLVDLIAEDGKISSRKFMEFGAWIAATVAFIWQVIDGKATTEWLAVYVGAFILGRVSGQAVHAYQNTRDPDKVEASREKARGLRERRLLSADDDLPDEISAK